MSSNIFRFHAVSSTPHKKQLLNQSGVTIWLTGLSGAGKSTTAFALDKQLLTNQVMSCVLDGDDLRHGLNSDLGFSLHDRSENIRRTGEVAKLFSSACFITIVSFISPYHSDRRKVRSSHENSGIPFLEVFVDTNLDVCEQRDPKGLYKLARSGKIEHFTGVDDPYEKPDSPELILNTEKMSTDDCVNSIINELASRNLIKIGDDK